MTDRTPQKNRGPFLAFNATFFDKHQKRLLWLTNHWLTRRWFRWVLRIRKADIGYDRQIVRLMPHAYVVAADRPGRFTADFRTHPKYGKRIYYAFRPIWWAMHFWDWAVADRFIPALSYGFSTLTVSPDADPETTSVDGDVGNSTGANFAAIRNAATGDSASDTNTFAYCGRASAGEVVRAFFLFDTSALTAGATITAAVLSLFSTNTKTDIDSSDTDIVASTPASSTSLSTADFDQVGATVFASRTLAGITTSAYNDFTLDSNGIANISKTGISKFAGRNSRDTDNATPTGENRWLVRTADQSGDSEDPKLVITYSTVVNETVSAAVQTLTASFPSPAVSGASLITAAVQSLVISIQESTFTNATNVSISAAVQVLTTSIQSAALSTAQVLTTAVQTLTSSMPSPSVSTNAVLSVAAQVASFILNVPSRIGSFYQDKYSSRGTSFSSKYSSRETSYDDKYTTRNH